MTPTAASLAPRLALGLALGLALLLPSCSGCPPRWADEPPTEPGWLYASGSAGEVFVEAEATDVALTRAAWMLADALEIDVEPRLSVRWLGGRMFVEAYEPTGRTLALDELELVELAECGGRTFALVRLPVE